MVEAQLVAVFFVEEVVDVDLCREVFVDLVAAHQVDHGVAVLAVVHVGARRRVFGLGPGAALPGNSAADGEATDAGDVVGGKEFQLSARVGGVQRFAFGVFAAPLGVARAEAQVFADVAACFQLEAADFRAFGGVVGGRGRVGASDGFVAALREVVLAGAEDARLGVEAAIEPVGFPAEFVGAATDGVKQVVVAVALGLWLVDVGVAGVHGLVRRDVVGDAGVGCPDGAVFLCKRLGVAFARAFPVGDAGADDGAELVGDAQAGGGVECGFGVGLVVAQAARAPVWPRVVAVLGVEVAGRGDVAFVPTVGAAVVAVVLDTGDEVVFLSPGLDFAVGLQLDGVLFGVGVEFARPRCPVEAVAVDAAAAECRRVRSRRWRCGGRL